jgi:hypothetical protein
MVDVDGVVVTHPHQQGWSHNLKQDLGLSPEVLHEYFFQPHFGDIVRGQAALRERLSPVLRKIAPHLTCDQLIEYWFANDANLNVETSEVSRRLFPNFAVSYQFRLIRRLDRKFGWLRGEPKFFMQKKFSCRRLQPSELVSSTVRERSDSACSVVTRVQVLEIPSRFRLLTVRPKSRFMP